MKYKILFLIVLLLIVGCVVQVEQIGFVDIVFKMFGLDYKIVVEVFDDLDVKNVICYVSWVKIGGIKGGLGLVEDIFDVVIFCQQVGLVELSEKIKNGKVQGDVVFQKWMLLVFKKLQVVCFYDVKCNILVYFVYFDKVVEGLLKNVISVVLIMLWWE